MTWVITPASQKTVATTLLVDRITLASFGFVRPENPVLLLPGLRCVVGNPCLLHVYEKPQNLVRMAVEQRQIPFRSVCKIILCLFVSIRGTHAEDGILSFKFKIETTVIWYACTIPRTFNLWSVNVSSFVLSERTSVGHAECLGSLELVRSQWNSVNHFPIITVDATYFPTFKRSYLSEKKLCLLSMPNSLLPYSTKFIGLSPSIAVEH